MKRGPGRPPGRKTIVSEWAEAFAAKATELSPIDDGTQWPSAKYRKDPEAFVRDVLGCGIWFRQREVLESVRDNLRTAVRSGNKCGKTELAALAALWFYSSYPDARVFITAANARTVTQAIWRAVRKRHAGAKIPLSGTPAQHAGSGLTAPDMRQILGFTAATKEDAAGMSGANMFYIVDEASGVKDPIFEGIEGNRAGGQVRVLLISNPTKTEGEFYEAFHAKAAFYHSITISGEETPNCTGIGEPIPGLASPEWIDEMARMHGVDSPFYKIRVRGLHVEGEAGKIFALQDILAAEERWADTEADGPLVIGVDPAGSGVGGDESVFAPRRGRKLLALYGHNAQTAAALLTHLEAYIKAHAPNEREKVTVVLDREGSVGAEVFGVLRAAAQSPRARFRVIGVRSSDKAQRLPMVYERVRDELWAAAEQWVKRDGGSIPEHGKLAKDLHAPSWGASVRNRQVVTDKSELRKILGRSPDYGDALCLACWVRGDEPEDKGDRPQANVADMRGGTLSPYGADRQLDPYGGRGR